MAEGRCKKCKDVVRQATVEPLLFVYMFAAVLSDPTQQALIYRKVCVRHLNAMTPAAVNATSWLMTTTTMNSSNGSVNGSWGSVGSSFGVTNEYICDNLKNESYRDLETAVQADASHWFLYAALCFEIPSVLVAFFYGSLSDHFSRKLSLIVPIIGQCIAVSNWIANSFYPAAPMGYLLIGPLISGCFGGWVTLLVGSMSYLSDISTDAERTSRIAIAEACIAVPIALSFFVSGVFLEATSFAVVLATTLALYLVCIAYACVRIQEPPGRVKEGATWGGLWRKVLGPSAVAAALKGVFRERTLNRRRQLIVLFASLVIGMISNEPTWSLGYLYTKKSPLSWAQHTYGYYAGYSLGLRSLMLLLIGPLFKRRLGMRDTAIMIFSLVTNAIGEAFMGFSTLTWMVFVAATICMFNSMRITCQRALMSTLVDKNELGQMFAVFGSLQSISMLIANNIYNNLYPHTLSFWPGFCFVMGAALAVIPLFMYIWLHRDLKKMEVYAKMSEDTTVEANGTSMSEPASENFNVPKTKEDNPNVFYVKDVPGETEDDGMVDIDMTKELVY